MQYPTDNKEFDYEKEQDFGETMVPTRYLESMLIAVGETLTHRQQNNAIRKMLDVKKSGGIEFVTFMKFLARRKLKRSTWGGRICITDDYPLPVCCSNPACKAHIERPTAADDDEEEERQKHFLYSVFSRHDRDGSGAVDVGEVAAILRDHNVEVDGISPATRSTSTTSTDPTRWNSRSSAR